MSDPSTASAPVKLPRVAITFCTQCRWMLRAAYFAQELMSTFGNSIGEVALIPATGGVFQVHLTYRPPQGQSTDGVSQDDETTLVQPEKILIWDRKSEGGFPETKVLKQKVRNLIEPERDLGHSDRQSAKKSGGSSAADVKVDSKVQEDPSVKMSTSKDTDGQACEDCK
ncbi:seleno protein domain-containing protein [Polychaeton citri CBS 116435]|uniref:Seleno protein domain-containing protein n=1 Tax=Polychaeton citri CBS 116435 TaxID=1314669 RepID=A0A9P4Q222_9PEZI|nr:seleno protein domain-containing protein [Polychaeton citri CBS 116435]